MDSGTHDDTDTAPPGGDEYGDHDEVFEMSSDESFLLDSGFQATMSPSQATPGTVCLIDCVEVMKSLEHIYDYLPGSHLHRQSFRNMYSCL